MKNILILVYICSFYILGQNLFCNQWHFPLYLNGGSPHLKRVEVKFENTNSYDIDGGQIRIGADILNLVGTSTSSVRIVAENGRELLYTISDNSAYFQETSKITIPIACKANSVSSIWIYYDNPSAWKLPVNLTKETSTGYESFESNTAIETDTPSGWSNSSADSTHINTWCTDFAHSGTRSLKTQIIGTSSKKWTCFYKRFNISEGTSYKISGWVKGENVVGRAGFYIHQGSPDKGVHNDNNSGTFDWKKIEFSGTLPQGATYLQFGTVHYSTSGTAWFDDIEITIEGEVYGLSYTVSAPEILQINTIKSTKNWELDKDIWNSRIVTSIVNIDSSPTAGALAIIPISRMVNGYFDASNYKIIIDGTETPFLIIGEQILFTVPTIAAHTEKQVNIYLKTGRKNMQIDATIGQSSDILSDYEMVSELPSNLENYQKLLNTSANLIKNPSFETNSDWTYDTNGSTITSKIVSTDSKFGTRSAELKFESTDGRWYGFRQDVNAQKNKRYVLLGWSKAVNGDEKGGAYLHIKQSDGSFHSYSSKISSSKEWRMFIIKDIINPYENAKLSVQCTSTFGNWRYDGIFLSEILPMGEYKTESSSDYNLRENSEIETSSEIKVWSVPSIVKVFPSTEFTANTDISVDMAANEYENLQVAFRSGASWQNLKISATPATLYDQQGNLSASIPTPEIGVVGYVKIDAPSGYYSFTSYKKYESCVPANTLGVLYPDPILPISTLDLSPAQTKAVHFTFKTFHDTPSGIYVGKIRISTDTEVLIEIPYSVNVWNFSISSEAPISAVFDLRSYSGAQYKNFTARSAAEFLSKRKLSIDKIPQSPTMWVDGNGKVCADFSSFEQEANYYLNELGLKTLYLPNSVWFGWGNPPQNFLGAQPYDGTYPYSNVDRSKLSSLYKSRAQSAIKLTMDFLRSKGWETRFVNYISDEPDYEKDVIIKQTTALCDLIHEVEPESKIYISTWYYVPEWKDKINVWGIGAQGQVDEQQISEIVKHSNIITTTDGQMCLDTPYNAIERLLPIYCFKYGFKGYEFWGADWYTVDPYDWGTHLVISQSATPGVMSRIRYPNGDGYIFYSGLRFNQTTPVPSVRSESLRDGIEDYQYCQLLSNLVDITQDKFGKEALDNIKKYVKIPNAGGRNSIYLMANPQEYLSLRKNVAEQIVRLKNVINNTPDYYSWVGEKFPNLTENDLRPDASLMNDGITNLEKFTFGLDLNLPASSRDFININKDFLSVKMRKIAKAKIQKSSDLINWQDATDVEIEPIDSDFSHYKIMNKNAEGALFYRVLIEP